ncbi:MAG: hypothetical protein J6Y94_00335, partial [Bacteriovoracaceae bacterium]|nr:hypothetical protein [Bacteriovoracaceae bacterium]
LELVPPLQSGVPKPVAPDGYYHIGAFDEEGLVLRAHFSEGMQTAAEEATPVGELHIGVREDPAGMFAVPCNFAPPLENDTPEESIYACILNPIEGQRSLAQPLVPDGASSGTAEDDFKHYFLIFTPMALASDYAFKINTEDDRESFKDKAGNYPDTISTVGPATTEGPPPEPEYFLKMAFPFGEMPFKVAQTINGVPTYVDFDPADTTGTKPKGIILNDGQKLKIYRMEVEVRPEDKKEYNGKIYIRKDSAINFKYFFTHEITKQKDDAQYFLPLSVQEGVTPEEEIIYGAATCDVISASEIPLDESTTLAKNNILNCTYLVTENSTTNNEVLKYKAHHLLEPEWGSGAALLLEEAEGEEGQNFLTDYAGNGIPQTKASFQVGPHLAYYPYNEGVMAEDFGIYIDGIEPHFTEIEVDGVVPLRNYTNTLRKGDKISWHFTFNESIVQAGAAAQAAAGNNTLDPINPYFKICRRENAEQNRDDLPVLLKDWREEDISEICILNEDGIDQLCCEDSNAAAVICVMDPPGPEPEKTGMTCSYTVQEGDYSNHLKYTSFAKLVMFNYEKWIDNSGNNIASPLNVFRAQPAAEETVDGWKTILTYRMDGEAPELLEVTSDKHANEDSTEEVFVPHNSYINIFLSFEGPVGGKERLVVSPMETDQPYIMLNVHRGDADKIKVPCYPMADKDFHKLRCPYKVEDGDYTPVISYDPETNYPIRASITIQSFGGVVSDEYGNQIDVRKTNRILRGKEKGYGHINLGVDGKQPIKIISASKSTAKVDAIRIDDRILPGSYTYNDNQLKYYFIDHCPYYGDCANTLVFHVYFNEPIQGSAKLRLNVKDKEYKALPTADAECRVLNPPPVSNALTCSLIIDDGYETHSADGQEEYLEYVSIYGLMKTEGGDGITDMAGNPANVVLPAINPDPLTSRSLSASQIVLDSNYPKVLSISSRDKVGTVFKSGQVINVQVNFSERIYANGDEFLLR